ncbi:SDR family NAD(P)-dependent oxidoreductase [Laribacter hongkongensis]|uniref:SDR family NAD(P)-dependent oxidoreductase n=1 Tax=Laribacter hongkongensis TaxID=168471 RepID=UPI001EFCB722|nr:SDR family NAD(P)-dependent oxidoreductase [Laribacter hongkongensis]MCG9051904.1 SDR family NAD(P)-dependent oxidoreductase [Laribacter hongkongensis]
MHEKRILVTGCSSGIGLASALCLQQAGWQVFASARRAEDVEKLRPQFPLALQMDVDSSESIRAGVARVLEQTGGMLDAVFSNAGFGQPGAVEDIPRNALRQQFETNVFGTWELVSEVLPVMRRQGHGRILFNSSVLGFAPMRWRGAYNASKFALEGMVDTLRLELDGTGIQVSLVEPGPIVSRFRPNALQHFLVHVDHRHSVHADVYERELQRLQKEGEATRFTLPASAVAEVVVHALNARHQKARYRVTFPTHLFWWLRHVLPQRALDRLLIRAAG